MIVLAGVDVFCRVPYQPMPPCDHEEADTRICVHLKNAMEKGARKVFLRTVETDVIVVIAGIFFDHKRTYSNLDIWVAFGMGKHFQHYHLNTICHSLGVGKCKSLPFYHAFTGCDTTSQFLGKGKKTSWGAWKAYSSATTAFQHAVNNPFEVLDLASTAFQILERFTCVLYDKTTSITTVNDLRQDLFSKRAKLMDNIPPTQVRDAYINWQLWFIFVSYQAALIQHTNQALYQASIWRICLRTQQNIPTPE